MMRAAIRGENTMLAAITEGQVAVSLFAWGVVLLIYFMPTIAAANRKHHNTGPIAVVNIFLGWTLIGWVVALAWAFTNKPSST